MTFREDGAATLEWVASYLDRLREFPVLAQVAGRNLCEHGKLAQPLEVRRHPLERRGAVVAERHLRSFSIAFHGRVLTICSFVSHARRA